MSAVPTTVGPIAEGEKQLLASVGVPVEVIAINIENGAKPATFGDAAEGLICVRGVVTASIVVKAPDGSLWKLDCPPPLAALLRGAESL